MSERKERVILCPDCGNMHIDVGEWAERPHHKHLCHYCHHIWRLDEIVFGGSGYGPPYLFSHTERLKAVIHAQGFDSGCQYSNKQISALQERVTELEGLLTEIKRVASYPKIVFSNELFNRIKAALKETTNDTQ